MSRGMRASKLKIWNGAAYRQRPAQRRRPAPDVVVGLDLQQQRHPTADQRRQAVQVGIGPSPSLSRPSSTSRDCPIRIRLAPRLGIGVVEDQNFIVRGQAQVALDAGARFERGGEGNPDLSGNPEP